MHSSPVNRVLQSYRNLGELPGIAPWIGRWAMAAIMLPIIGVGLAAALGIQYKTARYQLGDPLAWSAAASAVLAFAGCIWLARRDRPLPISAFLIVTTLLAAIVRVNYSLVMVPEWTSDFISYWNTALKQVSTGDFTVDGFYTERSLPVLVPLVALFGDVPYAVKAANIAMLGIVQLAGYDILRRLVSHQAGQAFTLGFVVAPIPLFALTIPSHDLWALFFLAITVWLCALLLTARSQRRLVLLACITSALALLCLLMEIQRGVGTILALALLIASVLGWAMAANSARNDPRPRMLAIACALALLAQFPLGVLTASLGLRAAEAPAQKTYMLAYYGTHGTSMGNGTWGWMRVFQGEFTDGLQAQPARLQELSRSLMLSDWSEQPGRRVVNVAKRLKGLYFLDNSNFWYFAKIEPSKLQAWLGTYSLCFSTIFSVLLLLAIARSLMGIDPTTPTLACMVFIAIVSLALASFSENQPRYIMWLWLGGMLWLAEMLARRSPRPAFSAIRGISLSAAALSACAVLLVGLWAVVASAYGPAQGRILGDWTDPATGSEIGALHVPAPSDPYVHATQPGELSVALGAGALPAVEHRVCVDANSPRGLTFFLESASAVPGDALMIRFGSAPPQRVGLDTANGKSVDVRLPGEFQAGGCHQLRLELVGPGHARATVEFPRLER